jgi:hypothetical protein
MRLRGRVILFCAAVGFAGGPALCQEPSAVEIPGGAPGIGFDDLRFAPSLKSLLVPAGRAGVLAMVDPATRSVQTVGGFSAKAVFSGGHDDGVTSADEGKGWVFATDRTSGLLAIVDPRSRKIVATAKLSGAPDYARFVEAAGEVWVTEPDKERIEIFRLSPGNPPSVTHGSFLAVAGGPESLVVDAKRGRAYSHLWGGKTVAIDVKSHRILATWSNGCAGSRGIALDEPRDFLFVGCGEGKAVVLDAATGKELSSLTAGGGVDIIDYSDKLSHLYFPGGKSATMAILGVSAKGELTLLGTVPTAAGAHCVATDGNGKVFVCDPKKGRLLLFEDGYR